MSVLDYRSDDDFVVSLNAASDVDQIVLAKTKPEASLQATIDAVEDRIKNSKLSKYWLWLVIIAGISMAVPFSSHEGQLSVLYLDAFHSFDNFHPKTGLVESHSDSLIIIHASISVPLAVIFTVISQVAAKSARKPIPGEASRFIVSSLLVVTTAIGCIFGLFEFLGSEPVLYFVILLFAAGRVVSLYITAFFFAREVPENQDENKL